MKLPQIPVIKLPVVDVTTDPLDMFVTALTWRMNYLVRHNPDFLPLIHERECSIHFANQQGLCYRLAVKQNRVIHESGTGKNGDLVITFSDSQYGVTTLLKGSNKAFMQGMQDGKIIMEGDYSLLVWFNQIALFIKPQMPPALTQGLSQAQQGLEQLKAVIKSKLGK